MAFIDRDAGPGGIPEMPMVPEAGIMTDLPELPQDPNLFEFDDGSAIVGDYEDDTIMQEPVPFDGNLAEGIDDAALGRIASDLVGSIEDDLASREDWEDTYKQGLEFLGMKTEERSEPFEGSSGVIHPLLAESVTQFQAQAYRELLPANGPVRAQVIGVQSAELVQQAERVKDYMNYQITYEMEEYDPELDQMLFYLPVIGSTFKKVYHDPLKQRAVSNFIHAEDLIVPYGATDLASSPRITHRITMDSNEVRKLQLAGFYMDIDVPSEGMESDNFSEVQESINDIQGIHPSNSSSDLTLYEVHTSLDIEGFEDMDAQGEPTGLASTSILRQLSDAGTLANLPAGFKARGARIRDEDSPLQPGEFRDIDVVGSTLQASLMPLPFKEPSQTLYNLLGTLVDAGRRFASMADMKIGEMSGETPVGTTMAIMERGTKVMSAIHKRLHYSQKLEFKLLSKIFAKDLEPYPYMVSQQIGPEVKAQDFDQRIDVLPVSDPNIFSMSQRIALAQSELQLVQSNPQIHGGPQGLYQAYRKMYEALGVTNIDGILPPPPPPPPPINPAKENQNALMGQPLQAFPEQDHQAHIETHMAVMSTPAMQLNTAAIMSLQGHIQEHIGLMAEGQAQEQIMERIPQEIQQDQEQMQQMMEKIKPQIDQIAATIIADMTESLAQAVEPPPESDPLVDIRNQELQLKAADMERKTSEFEARQELDREKERNNVLVDQQRIDVSEAALEDKTRIAEERIQTQRDIAAVGAMKNAER